MNWETQLVSIYIIVSDLWKEGLFLHIERNSNNKFQEITDEEILTMLFFGILRGRSNIKSIFSYMENHYRDWFPGMSSYEAFNYRLNRLSETIPMLAEALVKLVLSKNMPILNNFRIIDSLPIYLAKQKRSSTAKVAQEFADKSFCASKGEFYYGVKLHVIGISQEKTLPLPEIAYLSPASTHDLIFLKEFSDNLWNLELVGDKAYCDKNFKAEMLEKSVKITTPIKKKKDSYKLCMFDKIKSTYVSKLRQPIESFFNWLIEKTGIQNGSKIRSSKGLYVHVFGKLSAGILSIILNNFNF